MRIPKASSTSYRLLTLFVATIDLVGCARGNYYSWGSYEDSVYRIHNSPESYILDDDLQQLASEIERTPRERIPPGKTAHVGFLFATKGDNVNARHYFELEKTLFPESTVLMDRLIAQSAPKSQTALAPTAQTPSGGALTAQKATTPRPTKQKPTRAAGSGKSAQPKGI